MVVSVMCLVCVLFHEMFFSLVSSKVHVGIYLAFREGM